MYGIIEAWRCGIRLVATACCLHPKLYAFALFLLSTATLAVNRILSPLLTICRARLLYNTTIYACIYVYADVY